MFILDWFNANSAAISAIATATIAVSAAITVVLAKNLANENRLLTMLS